MDFRKEAGDHPDIFVPLNQSSGNFRRLILSVQAVAEAFDHLGNRTETAKLRRFHAYTLQY